MNQNRCFFENLQILGHETAVKLDNMECKADIALDILAFIGLKTSALGL